MKDSSSPKCYFFNEQHAKLYGDREAVFLENLIHWVKVNKSKNKNLIEGRTWMFIARKNLQKVFPFWTPKQLYTTVQSLKQQKVIVTENHNQFKYNRTLWYALKNEALFLEEKPMKTTHAHFTERENGFSQTGLSLNNTNNKIKLKDYKNSPIRNRNGFEVNPEYHFDKRIENIIYAMKEQGQFRTIIPKDGQPISKILQTVIKYLHAIKSGIFPRYIDLDKVWQSKFIKHWPPSTGYETWREVKTVVMDSLQAFMEDNKNNSWQIQDMDKFFYHSPRGQSGEGKSMFLKYLNVKPRSANEQTAEWQYNHLPESVRDRFEGFNLSDLDDHGKLQFWSNMNLLVSWYNKNRETLVKYNEVYHDNGFGYHCSTVGDFFYLIVQYLGEQTKIFPRPIPPVDNNPFWNQFVDWMYESYSIELEPESERLNDMETAETQNKERDRIQKLNDMFAIIETECDMEGIPRPSMEELTRIAEKRILQKEADDVERRKQYLGRPGN